MSDQTTRRIGEALQRLQELYPSMRFGQLVCFAADLARDQREYGTYDVEDADLLRAIEAHLRSRSEATQPLEKKAS